jgi:hypothetical protein
MIKWLYCPKVTKHYIPKYVSGNFSNEEKKHPDGYYRQDAFDFLTGLNSTV